MPYHARESRYEGVEYARVGHSGLRLPRISLGLWNNFGDADGDRSPETQRAILLRAFDRGMTHFDLANNYGPPPGSAESNFGRVLASDLAPYRDEIVVSTKAGYGMWDGPYQDGGSRKYLLSSLDASLQRMGLDYVDIFYHHRPDPETPIEETMGALAHAVRSGKALYVGVSNYSAEQLRAAEAAIKAEGMHLTIAQPRFNMFDRTIEQGGLLPALDELGIGSIVFSPLAGGMLTDRYLNGIPADSRAARGRWISGDNISETYLERARALNEIAQGRGQSLAQLALTWTLRHPQVTSALIGASSVEQFEASWAAASAPELTDAELEAIEPLAVHGTERG